MREIKFRLPIKLNGQKSFLYYNLNEVVTGGGINLSLFDWHGDFGSFTGLKDKNGREIYEDDILKTIPLFSKIGCDSSDKFEVIFQYAKFRLKQVKTGHIFIDFGDYDYINTVNQNEVEVVGNTFENKYLLAKVP